MWSMELCLLEVPVTSREDMERKPWAEEAEGKGRTTGVSGGSDENRTGSCQGMPGSTRPCGEALQILTQILKSG